MVIDVELSRSQADWHMGAGVVIHNVNVVLVNEVGRPGLVASGWTELDALGAFREGRAFLMQLPVESIDLHVVETEAT